MGMPKPPAIPAPPPQPTPFSAMRGVAGGQKQAAANAEGAGFGGTLLTDPEGLKAVASGKAQLTGQ